MMLKSLTDLLACHGQSYNNGINMTGNYKGLQSRLLEMNEKALFVPRNVYTLNLVLWDCAQSSVVSVTFLGVVNHLYTLFLASTFEDIINVLISLKAECDTR